MGSCNTWATGDHEEWEIEKARDGYYTLTVGSSGKCLDADNYASKDMTECGNVQIWDCKDPATRNTDNQEWRIESVTDDEFRNPRQPMDYPVPDIKVNGSDRRTEVRRSSIVTVTFALNNHFTVGPDADWWIIQTGPYGLQFLTPTGWTTTPRPLLQGALFTFPSPVVELPLSTAGLATGTYWLYFAVDTNRDSNFSLNFLYLDGVRVDLVP